MYSAPYTGYRSSDLLTPYTASRSLRSSSQLLLSVPRSCFKAKGDQAFSVAAPRLCNSLQKDTFLFFVLILFFGGVQFSIVHLFFVLFSVLSLKQF